MTQKYKQSFAAKHFPFEYENPDNEIPEPRIYFEDDGFEDFNFEPGSGELDLMNAKGKNLELYLYPYLKKMQYTIIII